MAKADPTHTDAPTRSHVDTTKLTVRLAGGGSLTLDVDGINLLALPEADRTFLFTLIDSVHAFDRAQSQTA